MCVISSASGDFSEERGWKLFVRNLIHCVVFDGKWMSSWLFTSDSLILLQICQSLCLPYIACITCKKNMSQFNFFSAHGVLNIVHDIPWADNCFLIVQELFPKHILCWESSGMTRSQEHSINISAHDKRSSADSLFCTVTRHTKYGPLL